MKKTRGRKSEGGSKKRWWLQWRREGKVEPGQGGNKPWKAKFHGQISGRQSHTASPSSFGWCTISCQAQKTSPDGAKWKLQTVHFAQEQECWSSCPNALSQGQYTWQHNQVLKPITDAISKGISSHSQACNACVMVFVKGRTVATGRK